MTNTINQETCKKCKLCIEVCPCNIFGINEAEEVNFIPERENICIHCGQCMAICKTKSIQVKDLSYDNMYDLPENKVIYDEYIKFIATRRSVRNFTDKPVPREIIKEIIDSLAYAPFGAAPDKVNVTIVNNRKVIKSALPLISEFLDAVVKWMDNPFMRFMIKRKKGTEKLNTLKNHLYPIAKAGNYKLKYGDRITRNAPVMLIFHAEKKAEEHTNNSLIYAVYTMLAAHSHGLGATMIGIVPAAINNVKKVKEIFLIPEENEAIMSLIIGFPKYSYRRAIKRDKNIIWIK